jgi:hypothetical protein
MLGRLVWIGALMFFATASTHTQAATLAQAPAGSDPYTVRDIRVDATADSAEAARGQAVAQGERLAFEKLIETLVPAGERGQVPEVSGAELARLILGYEVQEERTSPTRYLGTLSFAFSKTQVTDLLRQSGASFASGSRSALLIVPIFESGGERVLWEEPNPWREAWYQVPPGGAVPTVVPFGDIADIRDVSTGQALSGDRDALMKLAKRYEASGAAVVSLSPRAGGEAQLTIRRIGPEGLGAMLVESVQLGDQAVEAERLKPAVERTLALLDEEWRQDNLVRPGVETKVPVVVPIDSMARWVEIRRALDGASIVPRYEVLQLTRSMAAVDLFVNGTVEGAEAALARRNLEFVPTYQGLVLKQFGQIMPFDRAAPGTVPSLTAPSGSNGGSPSAPAPSTIIPATGGVSSGG